MTIPRFILVLAVLCLTSCFGGSCDESKAYNKMLAIGKVQGRIAGVGGDGGSAFAVQLGIESGAISELIAQKKYDEACRKADELAQKYGLDLDAEQKNMITFEQLQKDGGKGSGTCSIADAAKKQMEIHGMLQKEVDAGKRSSDVFRDFGEDTRKLGELMSTDPSAACKLLDDVKTKYNL